MSDNDNKPTFDPRIPNSTLYATKFGGKKPTSLKVFKFLAIVVVVVVLVVLLF